MSDIIVLRLVSGENILADVDTEHSSTHVLAKHPTMIQAGPNPQTGQVYIETLLNPFLLPLAYLH